MVVRPEKNTHSIPVSLFSQEAKSTYTRGPVPCGIDPIQRERERDLLAMLFSNVVCLLLSSAQVLGILLAKLKYVTDH